MSKEMFVNAIDSEECRIAVMEDGELQELYIERSSLGHHVGNVYKGRVTNIEPSIQAAFVDYGQPKNGFLHVSDVSPSYHPESVKARGQMRPPIERVLKRGQEVIVQVTKEGLGTKGATMSTYLSIAGRYLVLMPGLSRVGVSRKIEDDDSRHKLRDVLATLERPKNMGLIARTAGLDQPKRELQRDLIYLKRVWKLISDRIATSKAPAEIFRESDLVVRTMRDIFTTDIERVYIDDADVARRARDFLEMTMPRYADCVTLYDDRIPLFHRFGLEEEVAKVYDRTVPLPCGGYLVIDQAEALVAIDVNSGKFRAEKNAEESAFKLNLEAAKEIARQLRLRDMGGVIVMDFVDMRAEKHRRGVEEMLRKELKRDRARQKVLKTSKFGLIEMTRQRMRPSIERSTFMECPHCHGSGLIKTAESMSLEVMRQLALAVSQENVQQVEVTVHPTVGHYIHNRKRRALVKLEERSGKKIMVLSDDHGGQEMVQFHCQDNRGLPVKFDPQEAARQQRLKVQQQQKAAPSPAPAVSASPAAKESAPAPDEDETEWEATSKTPSQQPDDAATKATGAAGDPGVAGAPSGTGAKRSRSRGGRRRRSKAKRDATPAPGNGAPGGDATGGGLAQAQAAPGDTARDPSVAGLVAVVGVSAKPAAPAAAEATPSATDAAATAAASPETPTDAAKAKPKRRRRRRSAKKPPQDGQSPPAANGQAGPSGQAQG
ncbi:MAG: Rne/Rng family ribonuclease [Phycisphaerae bacterium]|nr:Rne/Rng family ribonuclease [Phycisphaerae bacterium]